MLRTELDYGTSHLIMGSVFAAKISGSFITKSDHIFLQSFSAIAKIRNRGVDLRDPRNAAAITKFQPRLLATFHEGGKANGNPIAL